MTYSEIMAALLQAYEAHPEMEVEQIIAQVAREMGASERCMEDINSSLSLLDKMQEKKSSLACLVAENHCAPRHRRLCSIRLC